MVCGSLAYFLHLQGGVPAGPAVWLVDGIAVLLGLLLVSEVPMFGMKIKKGHKLLDVKRVAFLILALAAILAVVLFKQNWSLAVLAAFSLYIVENLVLAAINSFPRGA
jgi:phosphatidylserine synthase